MQRFFHDIVDQLQTMNVNRSSGSSYAPSFASSSIPSTPRQEVANQFDDADGDSDEADGYVAQSPALGSTSPMRPPLTRGQASHASGTSSIGVRPLSIRRPGPAPPPSPRQRPSPQMAGYPRDKENAAPGLRAVEAAPTAGRKAPQPLGLGLAIQSSAMGPPPPPTTTAKLLKKRSYASPVMPASPIFSDYSATSTGSAHSSVPTQKGSWFANLFNWKQLVRPLASSPWAPC
jgi:hypothetical protein